MGKDYRKKLGKSWEKDLKENQNIIKKLDNAPFSIREKKGRYYARAFFSVDGQRLQKEFALGPSLEMDRLLILWQDVENVKAGKASIDSLDKWGKKKRLPKAESLLKDKDLVSIGDAIALFYKDFWNRRSSDNLKAQTTWKGYLEVIGKIPQSSFNKLASIETLTELITNESNPETRKREKWVLVCGMLARFAGIKDTLGIKKLKGDRRSGCDRYVPSDAEIITAWGSISDPAWRWAFGILAAYGLRPSEIFHLDFARLGEGIIKVGPDTKTGERIVFPLPKSWLVDWGLKSPNYPSNLIPRNLAHLSNKDKAARISRKFKSLNLGFTPYSLRDGYALRGSVLGISPSVISKWMGHSLQVHYSSYQRYLSEREWSQVWEKLDD